MSTPTELFILYCEKYRTLLAGQTVKQIDTQKEPVGRISFRAWSKVRLERLAEERQIALVAELRIMFPNITDSELEKVDLECGSGNYTGLIVKPKVIEEVPDAK